VFDVFGSLTLLLLLSPVFALLIYKVGRDGGKPFFGHTRIGQGGKPFQCYKFRSMVVNAQEVLVKLLANDPMAKAEWDRDFKLKNDPRVSQLGAFLRRSSLDELPQLWNVFMGHMSLVGPRPIVQAELDRYGDDKDYYLMAKPGMTGLWQVSGRNDVDYATRVYLDSWYVKNWSLWSDIAILFKTVSVVTKRSGAY
jgi:undecaprenyl-phosphate galactose phosphotransferase